MPRLYRPPIPLKVKCLTALRQLGGRELPELVIARWRASSTLAQLLEVLRAGLAKKFSCAVKDLRLDHDPALGLRRRRGEGKRTIYDPPANDPDHMNYRPHGAEFAGSHDVKTRIRGDGAQFSDVALMKRERRRAKKEAANPTSRKTRLKAPRAKNLKKKRPVWRSRPMGKADNSRWQSRPFRGK